MRENPIFGQIFPQGEKLPEEFSAYFIGQAYRAPLVRDEALNCPVSNVTFSPGCRNNWHSHTGGQLLLVTAGRGYYQERGEPARLLLPGDVVEIAPDVEHWHGAAPDSWFAHLAVETNPQTNENRWLEPVDDAQYAAATAGMEEFRSRMSRAALRNFDALLPACKSELEQSDPELAEIVGNFAFDEVLRYGELDERTRRMTLLASAIALQAEGVYRSLLDAALDGGVTPVEVKEILYQAVPYVGLARTFDFIGIANVVLRRRGVALPLEGQSTVSSDDRFEKGLAVQRSIFGERIDRMHEEAPENQVHIQRYLSADCFGDYYTRGGLDVKTRELLTFSMLVSLGGCEAQVKGHIQGNANVGNGTAGRRYAAASLHWLPAHAQCDRLSERSDSRINEKNDSPYVRNPLVDRRVARCGGDRIRQSAEFRPLAARRAVGAYPPFAQLPRRAVPQPASYAADDFRQRVCGQHVGYSLRE